MLNKMDTGMKTGDGKPIFGNSVLVYGNDEDDLEEVEVVFKEASFGINGKYGFVPLRNVNLGVYRLKDVVVNDKLIEDEKTVEKRKLFLRVGMTIEIEQEKTGNSEEVLKAILNGTLNGDTYAPLSLGLSDDEQNGWLTEELNYEFFKPLQEGVLQSLSVNGLITELEKRN